MNDRRSPLAGVRVLAQGLVWAGPFATIILADLGAEVIEIESIQHLSPTRAVLGRHMPDVVMQGRIGAVYLNRDGSEGFWDRNVSFNYAKRGCLSATFDLETGRGHELFLELVKKSDVFLENNAAGVVEHLGIGWDVLHAANPRLVMVRFPGFGITGPYAHHKGYGMDMEAVVGHTMVRGYADSDPSTTPVSVQSDPNAGTHAAWAVQAALLARERTGTGQLIEISQAEAVLHHIAFDVLAYAFNGREGGPRGNDHPAFAPYGVFPCAGQDRWIAIACTSDTAFAALMQQLDAPRFADDERFATSIARLRNRKAVNELVADRTRRHVAEELAARLQGSRVAAAALAHQQEMHSDEHLTARRYFTPITHRAAGTHVYPGPLGKLQHTADVPPFRPAPTLGQHNEYVYKEVIGLSGEEYQKLVDDQVIGTVYLETAHA
jgi:crotonobetainyl-CoA:carnitine CoA-transferase CaiB-like acyl-CoA transferase